MNNIEPAAILRMKGRGDLDVYLKIQRNRMNFALCECAAMPSDDKLEYVLELVRCETGISLSGDNFRRILDLYPIQRSVIAVHDPRRDTEAREAVFNVIADFFLGTSWPCYADQVDVARFAEILKLQASAMDFVTDPS